MKTVRAEIDWIEVEITIQGTTNLKAIRRAVVEATGGGKAYVTVMNDDPNSASVFRFQIHDPNKFALVGAVLLRLDQRFLFSLPPTVTAIEIALDDYSQGPEQVADWYYGLSILADPTNHRLYRDFKGSGSAIPRHRDSFIRKIADGYQIGIGDKNADIYQHGYFKQSDHNKQPLPQAEHRARIEITLRQGQLPCAMLGDWASFPFEQLSGYFRFRTLKDNLPEFEQMILQGQQIGARGVINCKGGGTRLHNRHSKADLDNERVRSALRNLSRRWRSAKPGRPSNGMACGNSGNISAFNPSEHGGLSVRSNNYTSTIFTPTTQHNSFPSQEGQLPVLRDVGAVSDLEDYKVSPRISVLKTERK